MAQFVTKDTSCWRAAGVSTLLSERELSVTDAFYLGLLAI